MSMAKKFIPPLATGITLLFARPCPGWGSLAYCIQQKDAPAAAAVIITSITGVKVGGLGAQEKTEADVFGILNPVDFDNAPATKVGLITRLALEGIDAVESFITKTFNELKK